MAQQKIPSPAKKNKGTAIGLVAGIILAIMAVLILPTTILVTIGLVPSFVAIFADNSRERLLGPTVMALNLAGIMPALTRLWQQGNNVDTAIELLCQPMILLMILIPAGIGWLLFLYAPVLISGVMRRKAELRIRTLEKSQADLIEQWGMTVTGTSAREKEKLADS